VQRDQWACLRLPCPKLHQNQPDKLPQTGTSILVRKRGLEVGILTHLETLVATQSLRCGCLSNSASTVAIEAGLRSGRTCVAGAGDSLHCETVHAGIGKKCSLRRQQDIPNCVMNDSGLGCAQGKTSKKESKLPGFPVQARKEARS
jgi:hypothetical protein